MFSLLPLLACLQLCTASSNEPERSLEKCGNSQDGYLPSGITSENSALLGNDAVLSIDYPGYMTVVSIDFEGMSQTPPLSDWDITTNPNCHENNNMQISIPVADLVSWGTPSNGVIEFSMVVQAKYMSFDRVFGVYSEDTITKEIQVEIQAPTSYVVSVTFSLRPDSNFFRDIYNIFWDDSERILSLSFRTFVHESFRFDGAYTMESDFFKQGSDNLTLTSTMAYDHETEGEGWLQNWTLAFTNVSCVPNRVHTESFRLWLRTEHANKNGGFLSEPVDFHVEMDDGDCLPAVIPLDKEPVVDIGDENTPRDEEGRPIYWLDEPMHIMLTFDPTVMPRTTDLKRFLVQQKGQDVCPDCHLEEAFSFKCESCPDGSLKSPGASYNMSMFLHNTIFHLTESSGTPTTMEMEFEFTYDSRRELRTVRRQLIQETNADYDMNLIIQGFDCVNPKGLFGDTYEEVCAKGGTSTYHCERAGKAWRMTAECSAGAAQAAEGSQETLLDQVMGLGLMVLAVAALIVICCFCSLCYLCRRDKSKVLQAGQVPTDDVDHIIELGEIANDSNGYRPVSQEAELIARDLIGGTAATPGWTPRGGEEELSGFWGGEGEGEITTALGKRSPSDVRSKRSPTNGTYLITLEGDEETQKRGASLSSARATPTKRIPMSGSTFASEGDMTTTGLHSTVGSGGALVDDLSSDEENEISPTGGGLISATKGTDSSTDVPSKTTRKETVPFLSSDFTNDNDHELANELYGDKPTEAKAREGDETSQRALSGGEDLDEDLFEA